MCSSLGQRSFTWPMRFSHHSAEGRDSAEPPAPVMRSEAPTCVLKFRSNVRPTNPGPARFYVRVNDFFLEYIWDELLVVVYDVVFEKGRENLLNMIFGRYEAFTQKMESLLAHFNTNESLLVLFESHILDDFSLLRIICSSWLPKRSARSRMLL